MGLQAACAGEQRLQREACREPMRPPYWGRVFGGGSAPLQFFGLFDLEMTCFGVFCGAMFNILVTSEKL